MPNETKNSSAAATGADATRSKRASQSKSERGRRMSKYAKTSSDKVRQELQNQLCELMDVETEVARGMPKWQRAALLPELRNLIKSHLPETKIHARRLKRIAGLLGVSAMAKPYAALRALLKEIAQVVGKGKPSAMRDACLAARLQQIEHHEIAAYDTLWAWARVCGSREAMELCARTLGEEQRADDMLAKISGSVLLPKALWGSEKQQTNERTHMPRDYEERERGWRRGESYDEADGWDEGDGNEGSRQGGQASARPQQRNEYGQFEGNEGYDEDEDWNEQQRGSGRGFAGMDPERRRENAGRGGRASSQYEGQADYGQYEGEDDDYQQRRGQYWESDENEAARRPFRSEQYGGQGRYESEGDWENENRYRGEEGYGRSHGGRGFAGMEPEQRREIARRGGQASSRSQGRGQYGQYEGGNEWRGDERGDQGQGRGNYRSQSRSRDEYGHFQSGNGRRGQQGGSQGNRSRSGGSRRGFASMDPERRRQIAARGGRASHRG